ncbi:uncharacterized protein VTP21DRAFT_2124 [Calcarisporiella thermophila]|uniref:uncharacterized protein n=1 Tax=Calcarisporiella thermophila TaxID=911321 RepID=UPI003744609F
MSHLGDENNHLDFDDMDDDKKDFAIDEEADDGYLDLRGLEPKVWLVKVPTFLADSWAPHLEEEGKTLGRVRIYSDGPASEPQISIVLNDELTTDKVPREYKLRVVDANVTRKYVFTEDEKGSAALAGTVHHECTVTPVTDQSYTHILQRRTLNADNPRRSVQLLSDTDRRGTFLAPGAAGNALGVNTFIKPKPKPTQEAKATRIARHDLLDMLFKAFERYRYWSFKGLIEYTKQPAAYLKEIINEICVLNKKGAFNAMYELKEEFRSGKMATEGAEPGSAASRMRLGIENGNQAGTDAEGDEGDEDDAEDVDDEDVDMDMDVKME